MPSCYRKKIRVISLFSGIGAYERALSNIGVAFVLKHYCEIDLKASRCYSIIHDENEEKNLWDVKKIIPEKLPDFDLLVFSPPCQDISSIGQHAGINSDTRTGLMWDVIPIIASKKPRWIIMENVKNLAGKYQDQLDNYVKDLKKLGYNCWHEVLNAKDYGIPQARQRLYLVGMIDGVFLPPEKTECVKKVKDFIETGCLVDSIDRDIAMTIRIGGRKSKIGNRHNWDGYKINGKDYYLSAADCLRLMGFTTEDYNKLHAAGISEGRIAKVAGNSVAIPVLEKIFTNLLK